MKSLKEVIVKVLAECILHQQGLNREDRKALDIEEKILDAMLAYLSFKKQDKFSSNISHLHLFDVQELSDLFNVRKEQYKTFENILEEEESYTNKGYLIEGKKYYPLYQVLQKSLRKIAPLTLFYK